MANKEQSIMSESEKQDPHAPSTVLEERIKQAVKGCADDQEAKRKVCAMLPRAIFSKFTYAGPGQIEVMMWSHRGSPVQLHFYCPL